MQNNQPTDLVVSATAPLPATNLQYYGYDEEQIGHLRDYWHILMKRKWWFFAVLTVVMAITCAVTFLMTPVYMSRITLQIIQDNPSALMGGDKMDPLGALTGSSETDRFYETQYKILQSPTLAYGIMDTLNLQEHPSYKKIEENNKDNPPEVIRQKYAQFLLESMKVEPLKKSFLVNISYKSTDKELARKIPSTIESEYLKLAMNTRQQSYTMIREWLDGELTRLGKKLEISEQNVYTDGQKKDFLSLEDNQTNVIVQKYVELGKVLTTAQSEKAIKEAQYQQINEKGLDAPLITNNPLIQQLRQQLIGLESQVSGNTRIYGGKYPEHQAEVARVKELRDRLNQEVKRIETSIRADYETAARAEALLQNDFELQKSKVVDLQNNLVQHHILKRDLQTNQALYEALLARMKEASIASTMVASNVSVITPAEKPYKPWMPKVPLFLALGSMIGVIGGIITAFFIEYLDSSIKNTEEMERVCRIPTLGMVPMGDAKELVKQQQRPELVSYTHPMSMIGESIFHIRTAIMLSSSGSPPQVITITSASPGEGKTTTSSNIAIALAGADRKCLIIDCDLRKPRLHKVYNQPNLVGLTNYLTGSATLKEIVKPTPVPHLYFIPAGPTPPNPNDLFASEAFSNLIKLLRQNFDHIITDSPPVIGFADARTLSYQTDGTILVLRHHSTTREAAQLATQLLAQNNRRILGGILTMARKDRMGYGGYYGYYQYYNKYYKEYAETAKNQEERKLVQ